MEGKRGSEGLLKSVSNIDSIPMDSDDGLGYLQGEKMSYVNRTASEGTLLAPVYGGVPNMIIEVDKPSTSLK